MRVVLYKISRYVFSCNAGQKSYSNHWSNLDKVSNTRLNIIFILWELGKRRQWLQPGTNTYRSSCLWRRHKDWFVFLVSSLYIKIFTLLSFTLAKNMFGIWEHINTRYLQKYPVFMVSKIVSSLTLLVYMVIGCICITCEGQVKGGVTLGFFFLIVCFLLYFTLDCFGNRVCTQSVKWSFFRHSSQVLPYYWKRSRGNSTSAAFIYIIIWAVCLLRKCLFVPSKGRKCPFLPTNKD